jgi:hypothetical protein
MMPKTKLIPLILFAYIFVALTTFRFRNPKLTETELFLKIPAALVFQSK